MKGDKRGKVKRVATPAAKAENTGVRVKVVLWAN